MPWASPGVGPGQEMPVGEATGEWEGRPAVPQVAALTGPLLATLNYLGGHQQQGGKSK